MSNVVPVVLYSVASISVVVPYAFVGNMCMSPGLSCNGHIVVGGLSILVFFLLSIAIRQFTMLNIEEKPLTALFTSSMHFNCRLHSHEYSWRNGYQTILCGMIQFANSAHGW